MIKSLLLAATVTLVLGTVCLQAWTVVTFPGRDVLALLGVAVSIAAGPFILWRRRCPSLIPISAAYCVVMFFALFWIDFMIGLRLGRVDL